jgi:hypothetical protein
MVLYFWFLCQLDYFDKTVHSEHHISMSTQLQMYLKIAIFYALAFIFELLSEQNKFFWIVYLPIATAGNVLLFDLLVKTVDFEEIGQLEGQNKYLYLLVLAILASGFAISTAIFLK